MFHVLRYFFTSSLLTLTSVALAAPVSIVNHSFEDDMIPRDGNTATVASPTDDYNPNLLPTGWLGFNDGRGGDSGNRGIVSHASDSFFNASLTNTPDTDANDQSLFTAARDVYQILPSTLAANTVYTLSIDIGDRIFSNAGGNPGTPVIRLGYGSTPNSQVILELNQSNQVSQVDGNWVTWTGQITTGENPTGIGQALRIELTTGENVGWFDNVRLDAVTDNPPIELIPITVYLLGGQSNMQGVGRKSKLSAEQASIPEIQLYHSAGISSTGGANEWMTLRAAGFNSVSFGPEIGFGEALRELSEGENIALIKHAVGGKNLISDWRPGDNANETGDWGPQFSTFVTTVNNGIAKLEVQGYAPVIKGMIWQQGERDATNISHSNQYGVNLSHFIGRIREQFASHASEEGIRFVAGQVLPYAPAGGQTVISYPGRDIVRQAILDADEDSGNVMSVFNTGIVPTNSIDHPTHEQDLDGYRDDDEVHLDSGAALTLGRSMAYEMLKLTMNYPEWSLSHGLSGGPTDDDDADGCLNLEEYYSGSDPNEPTSMARPTADIESIDGQDYLTMTYTQNLYAKDFRGTPEVSTDLNQWNLTTLPVFIESNMTESGSFTKKYRAPWDLSNPAHSRMFLRLHIEP